MEIARRKSASTCLAKLAELKKAGSFPDPGEESDGLDDDQDASFNEYSSSGTETTSQSSDSNPSSVSESASHSTAQSTAVTNRRPQRQLAKHVTTTATTKRLPTQPEKQPLLDELIRIPMRCNDSSSPTLLRTKSPLIIFLSQSRRKQWTSIDGKVMFHFNTALTRMDMSGISHPFSVYNHEYRSELEKCQRILFPTTASWYIPCRPQDVSALIPSPKFSPTYGVCSRNSVFNTFKSLERFKFDPANNLLYVGGTVRLLAWCPSNLTREKLLSNEEEESSFLAVVSYTSPGTRVLYSDPKGVDDCLIQIWNCGNLALTQQTSNLQPTPHLFIAHSWGHVTDMCWLPVPLTLVFRAPTAGVTQQATFIPTTSVQRVLNHLLVACRDGQVRLFAVPRCRLDQGSTAKKRDPPAFTPFDSYTIKLSICLGELPKWIGWPTRIHIRKEFPHRLLVGYSTGHIAYFDLGSLSPLVSSMSQCHLAPIRLFRLIKGPVRSLSLNPSNGRHFLAQGFDRQVRIWDLEDSASLTPDSPEIEWNNYAGLASAGTAGFFWLPPYGDFICLSRDYAFAKRIMTTKRASAFHSLGNLVERLENHVYLFSADAPTRSARHLIPLGIQTNSSVDYCEALNSLLLATDRGRLEAIMLSLDDRKCGEPHARYLPKLRYPLCQWTLVDRDLVPKEKKKIDRKKGQVTHMADIVSAPRAVDHIVSSATASRDHECPDCHLDRSYCWHRLWGEDRLHLYLHNIPSKPFSDFVKTPLLNISQARFCPNIQSSTWIAVGTSFGFVQFICAEKLYRKKMDLLINRTLQTTPSGDPNEYSTQFDKKVRTRKLRQRSSSEETIPARGDCYCTDLLHPETGFRQGELAVTTLSSSLHDLRVRIADQLGDDDQSSHDTEPCRLDESWDLVGTMPTQADGDSKMGMDVVN